MQEEERRLVEGHLQTCEVCRREAGLLSAVRRAVEADRTELRPATDLYARTRERLRDRSLLSRAVRVLGRAVAPVPLYARLVFAAQLAVIVVLVGIPVTEQAPTTLSGPPEPARGGVRIQVLFREQATAAEISRALSAAGVGTVDGPSPLGVYLVSWRPKPENRLPRCSAG